MKTTLSVLMLILLGCTLTPHVCAQKQQVTISLNTNELPGEYGYYCDSIIDMRLVRENIGFAQVGLNNRNVPVFFEDNILRHLKTSFDVMIPKSTNPGLVFIIHELNVSELTKATKEFGFCNVTLEFARNENGKLVSLGKFSSTKEERAADVTRGHAGRIKSAIIECLYNFNQSDWKTMIGEEIKTKLETDKSTIKTAPPRGLYENFQQIIDGTPVADKDFILKDFSTKKLSKYFVRYKNNKRIKRPLFGVSDGKNLYINSALYGATSHFSKAIEYGRLVIFEGFFVDQGSVLLLGAAGGMTSREKRAIVLDSHTGLLIMLDNHNINQLLKDYPEIKKQFFSSERKLEDLKIALRKINAKY